jgi:uncharacterized membrane protein (UPF0127 family)
VLLLAPGVAAGLVLITAVAPADGDGECARWRRAFASMPERELRIETRDGALTVQARHAVTAEQQAGGFQCATRDEIRGTLILFDFRREILTDFHMRNVGAPLDIGFAKSDGRMFSILTMRPDPRLTYGPMGPFRWALEARAGFFAHHGIRAGEAHLVPTP